MSSQLDERIILLSLHNKIYGFHRDILLKKGTSPEEIYLLMRGGLENQEDEVKRFIFSLVSDRDLEKIEKISKWCHSQNIRIITWLDDDYPFRDISIPPPVIYIKGELPKPEKNPFIAFVGARKATDYGINTVIRLVSGLRPYRAAIISGLAYGIDIAAHRAAMKAGLPTIGILGCGIGFDYPAGHRRDKEEMIKNGALVSEFPPWAEPLKHHFPLRNRLISGISLGVVVVEAEKRSGSLITARWAADQGIAVFAVPGNVSRPMSRGTNHLIKEGAYLLEDAGDLARILTLKRRVKTSSFKKSAGHSSPDNDIKLTIQNFLRSGQLNLEKLAEITNLRVEELLPMVTEIEIQNL